MTVRTLEKGDADTRMSGERLDSLEDHVHGLVAVFPLER